MLLLSVTAATSKAGNPHSETLSDFRRIFLFIYLFICRCCCCCFQGTRLSTLKYQVGCFGGRHRKKKKKKKKGNTSEEKPPTRQTTLKAATRKLFREAGNSPGKMPLCVKIVAVSGEVTPGCGRSTCVFFPRPFFTLCTVKSDKKKEGTAQLDGRVCWDRDDTAARRLGAPLAVGLFFFFFFEGGKRET